jgi:hypothetical protein
MKQLSCQDGHPGNPHGPSAEEGWEIAPEALLNKDPTARNLTKAVGCQAALRLFEQRQSCAWRYFD